LNNIILLTTYHVLEDDIESVILAMTECKNNAQQCSTRTIGDMTNLSHTTTWKIMRKSLKLFPYKVQTGQALTDLHKEKRLTFCNKWMNNTFDDVLFSDESYFSVHGIVNRQNCRFWGSEKPEIVETLPQQFDQKIMAWAAFSKTFKVPIFFFENGTINEENYIDMIKNHLIPFLKTKHKFSTITFQQDGARPHTSDYAIDFLHRNFKNVISDRTENPWPPNSPDITPLDYFLWSYMKDKVYTFPRPTNLLTLKEKIVNVYANIDQEMLKNVIESLPYRLTLCQQNDGGHFENNLN